MNLSEPLALAPCSKAFTQVKCVKTLPLLHDCNAIFEKFPKPSSTILVFLLTSARLEKKMVKAYFFLCSKKMDRFGSNVC